MTNPPPGSTTDESPSRWEQIAPALLAGQWHMLTHAAAFEAAVAEAYRPQWTQVQRAEFRQQAALVFDRAVEVAMNYSWAGVIESRQASMGLVSDLEAGDPRPVADREVLMCNLCGLPPVLYFQDPHNERHLGACEFHAGEVAYDIAVSTSTAARGMGNDDDE